MFSISWIACYYLLTKRTRATIVRSGSAFVFVVPTTIPKPITVMRSTMENVPAPSIVRATYPIHSVGFELPVPACISTTRWWKDRLFEFLYKRTLNFALNKSHLSTAFYRTWAISSSIRSVSLFLCIFLMCLFLVLLLLVHTRYIH